MVASGVMKITVIGAGVAGLTAARALRRAGQEVRVLDKGRRVGGRISTRDADGGRFHFDHGAQYFTARSPAFRSQTEDWVRRGVAARWDGRIGVMRSDGLLPKEENPERFVGTPSMRSLAQDLARDLDVETNVRIHELVDDDGLWVPIDDTGARHDAADAVLVAIPPRQALPLVASSPRLAALARDVPMAPCWTLMVSFEQTLPIAYDGIFVDDGPLRWVARNSSKPGRDGIEDWVMQASDEWTEAHLDAERDAIVAELLGAFFTTFSLDPTKPRYARAHRWLYATPKPPSEEGCAFDETRRLGLAGDWLSRARVEGAYSSGLHAAERILGALRS